MAGFLRPFSQIALLVARSHERSQFAIRECSSALEQSHPSRFEAGHVSAIVHAICADARRLGARRARQRAQRIWVPSIASRERCRSLDAHRK
jgi:hypothetical protein